MPTHMNHLEEIQQVDNATNVCRDSNVSNFQITLEKQNIQPESYRKLYKIRFI